MKKDTDKTETNIAAISAGTRIHNMANSSEDYSNMPASKVVKDDNEFNYIQFMREPFKVGIIQEGMAQYTGSEEEERKNDGIKNLTNTDMTHFINNILGTDPAILPDFVNLLESLNPPIFRPTYFYKYSQ